MRYTASEKFEIIRHVKQSHLPAKVSGRTNLMVFNDKNCILKISITGLLV